MFSATGPATPLMIWAAILGVFAIAAVVVILRWQADNRSRE